MREIKGEKVLLKPLTRELCHEIYIKYVSDPMMTNKIYKYSKESVDDYYNRRINDNSRRMFAITVDWIAIGEVQIKYINNVVMNGNLGIHISNDEFKGKGYGTEAEKVIIKYAFEILNLKTLYADTVIRNTRSQHILEKLKFQFITEDKIFKYYKLEKSDY